MTIRILVLPLFFLSSLFDAIAQDKLPEDVVTFIDRRDGCDHFRGEEPYDQERMKFINKMIVELCSGTDKELEALREKYVDNSFVLERLVDYESNIELNE